MSINGPGEPENLIAAAIDAAEEIRDPLDGLVQKATADPGAPFAPDALERLTALKEEDRAAFETLRARLKQAGCRVTALDEALAEEQCAAETIRLAALSPIEYHRQSRDAAKRLGIARPTLTRLVSDAAKLVKARRPGTGGEMPSDLGETLAATDDARRGWRERAAMPWGSVRKRSGSVLTMPTCSSARMRGEPQRRR